MNVVRVATVDRNRESAYAEHQKQMVRLVAERARAIETLERVLALLGTQDTVRDRVEAYHVVREVLAELKALDPSGLDDEEVSSAMDNRLKAFRNVLSQSCLRIGGAQPLEH